MKAPLRTWHGWLVVAALLACRPLGGGDDSDDDDEDQDRAKPAPFVLDRPVDPQGVDACAFTGGTGMACLEALLAEQNAEARRFMRRLSDAHARLEGGKNGVPHAELAMFCKDSGPCGGKDANGAELDDGYACLTAAEAHRDDPAQMRAYHARACQCGHVRAQIPIMGGTLACDGPNQPVEHGGNLTPSEARDVDACGRCDHDRGPTACRTEIKRLSRSDAKLAQYVASVHVPRCQGKTPSAPPSASDGCEGLLVSTCDCPGGRLGSMMCENDRWSACDCSPGGLIEQHDPNTLAPDGLPLHIPSPGSPPPSTDEWEQVTKPCTVRGSSALKCETHMLREWLRVNCFENGFGAPTSLSFATVAGVQAYKNVRLGKKTSLVAQVVRGRTFRARFGWSDPAHPILRTLVVDWTATTERPDLHFE